MRGQRFAPKIVLLVGVAILMVSATACGGDSGAATGVDYQATALRSGEPVSTTSLRGTPALLVSWATWCRECDEELAGLQAFASSPDAEGLAIVAVNLDAADVETEIDAKIERHGLTVDLWRDRRNGFKKAFSALGVPTTVVLDRNGIVVGTFPGAVDFGDAKVMAAVSQARQTP